VVGTYLTRIEPVLKYRKGLDRSGFAGEGFTASLCFVADCEGPAGLNGQPVHLRSSLPVDVQMGKQGNPSLDPFHGGKPPLSGRQRIL
jgi:hypothetical protein